MQHRTDRKTSGWILSRQHTPLPVCRVLYPKPVTEAATAPVFSESSRIIVKKMESTDKEECPEHGSDESAGEIEI